MKQLRDRSTPAALGLLHVTRSRLIFGHKDCRLKGCFRSSLCSVHSFFSQLVSESHPDKAVSASDQLPRTGFDLCVETGLSSAGARPLLGVLDTNAETDTTAYLSQPCRKHTSIWLHILEKAELAVLRKFFLCTPLQVHRTTPEQCSRW